MPPPAPLTRSPPHSSSPSRVTACYISRPYQLLPHLRPCSSFFKTARIKPLLKKPTLDTTDVQNCRPISLLSFLSKKLERAISNQLSCYLSQNYLLDPHQSGFKTAHSTETALQGVTKSLRAARAWALSSVLILVKLSAAFDTVNHQILLATLAELDIADSSSTQLILPNKSHLSHRMDDPPVQGATDPSTHLKKYMRGNAACAQHISCPPHA